jgi:autotransporter-associated beta strand protein
LSGLVEVRNITVEEGTLSIAAGGALTIVGGTSTFSGAAARNISISSVITDGAGTVGITKTGANGLTLGAVNTFDGGFRLEQGTVTLALITTTGHFGTGTLTMAGGALTITNASRTVGNAVLVENNTTSILRGQTSQPTRSLSLTGNISGGGTLDRNGAVGDSAVVLTGNNTAFSGTYMNTVGVTRAGNALSTSGSAAYVLASAGADNNFVLSGIVDGTYAFGSLAGATTGDVLTSGTFGGVKTIQVGRSDSNPNTTLAGNIVNGVSGTLAFEKVGTSTQTLTGANTYSGGTTVTAGTLLISNASGSGTGSGTVLVGGSGTLGGTGIIGGATTVIGTLAPGASNSEGLLTFSNALSLSGNSANTNMQITGLTRGALGGYDAINVGASQLLTYDGTLTLSMTGLIADGSYDLFSVTAGFDAGGFDSIVFAGGAYSGTWTESLPGSGVWTASAGGQNFTFTETTGDLLVVAVPEPSTVLLLGAAGTFLLVFRRRSGNA